MDAAFCFSCCKAVISGKLKFKGTKEPTFLISGFTNWKDATRVMSKHGSCDFHKHASINYEFIQGREVRQRMFGEFV